MGTLAQVVQTPSLIADSSAIAKSRQDIFSTLEINPAFIDGSFIAPLGEYDAEDSNVSRRAEHQYQAHRPAAVRISSRAPDRSHWALHGAEDERSDPPGPACGAVPQRCQG